ncbi:IQ motif and SEC7 domain-containing protein 1 isoform X1 [Hydra vulgaris]|uniref:IQ motif and SEC7 domain-containing protein 1 isoform X1 n=1 Tax=Hydra vulgaris TaxID=6087 RepID=UPI0006410CF7|nr:IQ motif and SEC7 domain-containing protein 1 isoform X1 [Hydra vulgaris]
MADLSISDALKLIYQLQNYVVHKTEKIEFLIKELDLLRSECEALRKEVQILKKGSLCKCMVNTVSEVSDISNTNIRIASHGESTLYDIVNISRDTGGPALNNENVTFSSPKLARSSRLRNLPRDSSSIYQLSSDLREKAIECLENKYGGKEKANRAAKVIQHHYRRWIMHRSFQRMRAFSDRKNSLTKAPGNYFKKLQQTSLVFYGPENPVMIVDDNECQLDNKLSISSSDSEEPSSDAIDGSNSDLSNNTTNEAVINNFEQFHIDGTIPEELESSLENKDLDESQLEKTSISRLMSDVSDPYAEVEYEDTCNDYDIIEDSTISEIDDKHVKLQDGSSFVVDKIYDCDYTDGFSMNDSLILPEKFQPTVDKSTHKRQFRIGVNLFNWKPEVGIQYLIDNGHMEGDEKSIAEFFRKETMISKQKISEYFGNLRNDFNMRVLYEFAKSFDYVGKAVDEALRQFQSYFKLTGEAQTVEKFLQVFSERYVECNPGYISDNADTILLLSFALAMLNTDLHNQNVKQRMTIDDFLKNLRGTDKGNDLNHEMLKEMYLRIQKNEFATGADHTTQLRQIENSFIGKVPNIAACHRQFIKLFQVEQVYDPNRKDKPHNRLAFLFNDLLLLAKPRGKTGVHGSGHVFSCKASFSLLEKCVAVFSNENYKFGILLSGKFDKKVVAAFNTKDEKTRCSFVEELDEYIRETTGIENIRIALSKSKQLSWHNMRKEDRTKSLMLDQSVQIKKSIETNSLNDLHLIGKSTIKSGVFSSMSDINASSGKNDIHKGNIVRANSATSIVTSSSYKTESDTHHSRQSIFGNWPHKFRKSAGPTSNTIQDKNLKTLVLRHPGSPKLREYKLPENLDEGGSKWFLH